MNWDYEIRDMSKLTLNVRYAGYGSVLTRRGTFTTERLCQLLRSSQDIREGVKDVTIKVEETDCPDRDLIAVGNALHDLQRFDNLTLLLGNLSLNWSLTTDAKCSVLLRHVPKTKLRSLMIQGGSLEDPIPSVITELQQGKWLDSLTFFGLHNVCLDERDCDTLGQLLQSRRKENHPSIYICACIFPSLKGFLVLADALIDSGGFDDIHVRRNTVKDASIPSSVASWTHREFYCRFEREEEDDGEEEVYNRRFDNAAAGHLEKYCALNDAGRLAFLDPHHEATDEQWLEALGNFRVIDNVDYLFYFLRLKPGMIHA